MPFIKSLLKRNTKQFLSVEFHWFDVYELQTLNHKKRKEQVKKAFTQQSLFYAGINFCFVEDPTGIFVFFDANLAQPSISLLVGP